MPSPTTALPRTDPLEAKYRNARGQGPRARMQVFSKKKSSKHFLRQSLKKKTNNENVFKNFFQAISKRGKQKRSSQIFRKVSGVFHPNFIDSKNSAAAADRAIIFEDLRLRGQGQGPDLRGHGQGQRLQNVSSKPRTSLRTPALFLTH